MKKRKEIFNRIAADSRGILAVTAAIIASYLITHHFFRAFCPMLVVTGIPCAGCGLTRAGLFLLKGQVIRAARINPSIFVMLLFLLYCGYYRYVKGTKIKGIKFTIAALVLFMLVVYGIGMYRYFPEKAPYVYQRNNLCARFVPGYREFMSHLLTQIRSWKASLS